MIGDGQKYKMVIQQQRVDENDSPLSIVKQFSQIWQVWVDDPKLQSLIKSEEFQNVYASMSSYFTNFYLNGSKIEMRGRSILEPIKRTNQTSSVQFQNNNNVQSCSNKNIFQHKQNECRWSCAEEELQVQKNDNSPPPNEISGNTDSKAQIDFPFMGEVDFKLNRRHCSACLRYIPASTYMVNQHIKSRDHQRTVKIIMLIQGSKSSALPQQIHWSLDPFIGEPDNRNKRHCSACRLYVEGTESILEAHIRSLSHQEFLLQIIRDYENMQSASQSHAGSTEEDLFIRVLNKHKRFCLVCFCDVDSDKYSLHTHFIGSNHQKRLQQLNQVQNIASTSAAPEPVAGKALTSQNHSGYNFIGEINKRNRRYCLACVRFIPSDEKEVIQHVKSVDHDSEVVNFLQKLDSLESAGYRLICPITDGSNAQYCYLCNIFIGPKESDLEIHMHDFNHMLNLQIFCDTQKSESIRWLNVPKQEKDSKI